MLRLPSLAAFAVRAAAVAVAVSVLGAGQTVAGPASKNPGASPGGPRLVRGASAMPAAAARSGAAALPGSAAHRHPIRVGSVTIPPCKVSRLA
jgi:hypothetical protein